MNPDERRALWVGIGLLVVVSLARFGWEARPVPPVLPLDTSSYAALIPAVELAVAEDARRRTPLEPGERIDPNRADAVELARLPGVGPAMAARLLEAREARGWFLHADDLLEVQGVGPTTLERLRPHLVFTPPPAGMRLPMSSTGVSAGSRELGARTEQISLNRASPAELETLPGIGPALAARIVDDRARRGPYATLNDLTRVSGIGPTLVARLEGRVEVP
jgi:competence ComEA-like helix-hairpin-helix protein